MGFILRFFYKAARLKKFWHFRTYVLLQKVRKSKRVEITKVKIFHQESLHN